MADGPNFKENVADIKRYYTKIRYDIKKTMKNNPPRVGNPKGRISIPTESLSILIKNDHFTGIHTDYCIYTATITSLKVAYT